MKEIVLRWNLRQDMFDLCCQLNIFGNAGQGGLVIVKLFQIMRQPIFGPKAGGR
jgi:hypothetical protein